MALVTAAVALYRAGVSRLLPVLLALPAFFVTFDHAFPFGSLTFGTFFGALPGSNWCQEVHPPLGNPAA